MIHLSHSHRSHFIIHTVKCNPKMRIRQRWIALSALKQNRLSVSLMKIKKNDKNHRIILLKKRELTCYFRLENDSKVSIPFCTANDNILFCFIFLIFY